jgi:hypothetical protein
MPNSLINFLRLPVALFVIVQLQCPVRAADQLELTAACRLYCAGDIQGCLKHVEAVLKKQPKDSSAHFLKANCYVKLKKLPEAIYEYALVELCSPGSKLALQAKSASAHLQSYQLKSVAVKEISGDKRMKHLPPGTIELIRKQASQASTRAIEMGQVEAGDEVSKASNQAKAEQERAERMAQAAQRRGDVTGVSLQEAEIMRSRAQANAEQLRLNGEARAAFKEQEAKDKAENLQRQAEELEEQLVNDRPYKNREVKLNPIGTNLYTRNYSSTRAPVKPLDAQAFTLPGDVGTRKTSATMTSSGGSLSAVRSSSTIGKSGTQAETKVKGQVVPR